MIRKENRLRKNDVSIFANSQFTLNNLTLSSCWKCPSNSSPWKIIPKDLGQQISPTIQQLHHFQSSGLQTLDLSSSVQLLRCELVRRLFATINVIGTINVMQYCYLRSLLCMCKEGLGIIPS